ncbi:hypothetical protein LTR17_023016 [Elasticomyces elasticus]|nr:hypothetical protein LTR17_023016 [Elasticomyces elasticus]
MASIIKPYKRAEEKYKERAIALEKRVKDVLRPLPKDYYPKIEWFKPIKEKEKVRKGPNRGVTNNKREKETKKLLRLITRSNAAPRPPPTRGVEDYPPSFSRSKPPKKRAAPNDDRDSNNPASETSTPKKTPASKVATSKAAATGKTTPKRSPTSKPTTRGGAAKRSRRSKKQATLEEALEGETTVDKRQSTGTSHPSFLGIPTTTNPRFIKGGARPSNSEED